MNKFNRGDRVRFNKGITGTVFGETTSNLNSADAMYDDIERKHYLVKLDKPITCMLPDLMITVLPVSSENLTVLS